MLDGVWRSLTSIEFPEFEGYSSGEVPEEWRWVGLIEKLCHSASRVSPFQTRSKVVNFASSWMTNNLAEPQDSSQDSLDVPVESSGFESI